MNAFLNTESAVRYVDIFDRGALEQFEAAHAATYISEEHNPRFPRPRRPAMNPRDGVVLVLGLVLGAVFIFIGLGTVLSWALQAIQGVSP